MFLPSSPGQEQPLSKPGTTVSAGDVLISGTVDIYNDDGTIKETRQVHGDGDVYIRSVYHCEDYYRPAI